MFSQKLSFESIFGTTDPVTGVNVLQNTFTFTASYYIKDKIIYIIGKNQKRSWSSKTLVHL